MPSFWRMGRASWLNVRMNNYPRNSTQDPWEVCNKIGGSKNKEIETTVLFFYPLLFLVLGLKYLKYFESQRHLSSGDARWNSLQYVLRCRWGIQYKQEDEMIQIKFFQSKQPKTWGDFARQIEFANNNFSKLKKNYFGGKYFMFSSCHESQSKFRQSLAKL